MAFGFVAPGWLAEVAISLLVLQDTRPTRLLLFRTYLFSAMTANSNPDMSDHRSQILSIHWIEAVHVTSVGEMTSLMLLESYISFIT